MYFVSDFITILKITAPATCEGQIQSDFWRTNSSRIALLSEKVLDVLTHFSAKMRANLN